MEFAYIDIPMVYSLSPETNGRSLEDMGRIFSVPEQWWNIVGATRHLPMGEQEEIENFEKVDVKKLAVGEHVAEVHHEA